VAPILGIAGDIEFEKVHPTSAGIPLTAIGIQRCPRVVAQWWNPAPSQQVRGRIHRRNRRP
jgi:hypothetical protein